ncbi:MAG: acyl transferase [Bacteroidetes bacterium]|nr:acyl transferase [Bacteroidota bacterium]
MQEVHKIFGVTEQTFTQEALRIFRWQHAQNPVYRAYCEAIDISPAKVDTLEKIPYLPIRFFKTHQVKTTEFEPAIIFESSGTTGITPSRHYVKDLSLYEESFSRCFELFYGPVQRYTIFGLLPSYLERTGSSLVYMADRLMKASEQGHSRFYLHNIEEMTGWLQMQEQILDLPGHKGEKNLLLGVTYALLDLVEKMPMRLRHTIVMDTGGMKGRRREMIREEVHEQLCAGLGVEAIHSEYGMTELLSQAYSRGGGVYRCPPWMKVRVRDEEDPFCVRPSGSGILNVIDLANVYSCAFIATDDAGRLQADGSFEVLGRIDGSDMRGCSLLTA